MVSAYTCSVKPWVQYSLIRLGVFAVVLAGLLIINLVWYWAAIVAAIVGLCISYIFFGTLRNAVASDVAARRGTSVGPIADRDAAAEDQQIER